MSAKGASKVRNQGKVARLQLRLSTELKEKIRVAASLEGVSMSAFVLGNALEAANQVIEHETRVELGEKASLQVAEALARPARALPELVTLFRE